MSDISMIGLGAMGTALARAQVKAGHDVTVWNRSPQRMTPLVELGGNVRYGSKADIPRPSHLCTLLGAKRTLDVRFLSPNRFCTSECPLSGVKRT